jgi:hypothetical protein
MVVMVVMIVMVMVMVMVTNTVTRLESTKTHLHIYTHTHLHIYTSVYALTVGRIMNSWNASRLPACEPPLITLNEGTGRVKSGEGSEEV